jgi:hypothetical protein
MTITPDMILVRGLELVGFAKSRQNVCDKKLLMNFTAHYGADPDVYSSLWNDVRLIVAPGEERLLNLDHFLMSLHFLRCYPTAIQQEATFHLSIKTARKYTWFYIKKFAQLKAQKVRVRARIFLFLGYKHSADTLLCCIL